MATTGLLHHMVNRSCIVHPIVSMAKIVRWSEYKVASVKHTE